MISTQQHINKSYKDIFFTKKENDDKVKVIRLNEKGDSSRVLATNFEVGKTQINSIIKNKAAILKRTFYKKQETYINQDILVNDKYKF